MQTFSFLKTDDGSTGLYNHNVGDIYHAKQGALSEAYDKFINPSGFREFLSKNSNAKVLDICYGIGYNTKAALIEALNFDCKIEIDALDIDRELFLLSPYVKDGINSSQLASFLINSMRRKISNYDDEIKNILDENSDNSEFLNKFSFDEFESFKGHKFDFYIDDARKSLNELRGGYDFVFLDGFSPKKSPILWTINFLNLIKSKVKSSGIITTYTQSTPVRSAFEKLGFAVGKIISNGNDIGTIASLDCAKINNPLNEIELGLLNTRAGIVYRDIDFKLSASEIIQNREIEVLNSNLESRTSYAKRFNIK